MAQPAAYRLIQRTRAPNYHKVSERLMFEYFSNFPCRGLVRTLAEPAQCNKYKTEPNPQVEYAFDRLKNGERCNDGWRCDLFVKWWMEGKQVTEIVEVQSVHQESGYTYSINFSSYNEGLQIVEALRRDGLITKDKATDLRNNYLVCRKSNPRTGKHSKVRRKSGHINFRSNTDFNRRKLDAWTINAECELERKLRHAEGKSDLVSFAVPYNEYGLFLRDIKERKMKVACLYLMKTPERSEGCKNASEMVGVLPINLDEVLG